MGDEWPSKPPAPRGMNYTLTQAIDRAKDLSGIIKAARSHEADCAADHETKKNIASIAGEAHVKATAATVALEQERDELADHIAALVRRTGDPIEVEPLPENRFDVFGGFEAEALAKGEARINQAFDEATR